MECAAHASGGVVVKTQRREEENAGATAATALPHSSSSSPQTRSALPEGWSRILRQRGSSKKYYSIYISPNGARLRSMVEVQRYLAGQEVTLSKLVVTGNSNACTTEKESPMNKVKNVDRITSKKTPSTDQRRSSRKRVRTKRFVEKSESSSDTSLKRQKKTKTKKTKRHALKVTCKGVRGQKKRTSTDAVRDTRNVKKSKTLNRPTAATKTAFSMPSSPTCIWRWSSDRWRPSECEAVAKSRNTFAKTLCGDASIAFIPPRDANAAKRSAYARGRLRGVAHRRQSSFRHADLVRLYEQGSVDPLTMIRCEHCRPSGRFAQSFDVHVNPRAAFVCDLHAHLSNAEIIGLLCGRWDPEAKIVTIEQAFPCRSLQGVSNVHTNVEMDPVSELEIREIAKRRGFQVVGWYHSHPTFQTDPSVRDIENQASYQNLFLSTSTDSTSARGRSNSAKDSVAPFVGLIVGPYDTNLPSTYSWQQFFFVSNMKGIFGTPMHCKATYQLYHSCGGDDDDDGSSPPTDTSRSPGEIDRTADHISMRDARPLRVEANGIDTAASSLCDSIRPVELWTGFAKQLDRLRASNTSTEISRSLCSLRGLLCFENRCRGLDWKKCLRDILVVARDKNRIQSGDLWTEDVATKYRELLMSLTRATGFKFHMKQLTMANNIVDGFGSDMEYTCAQMIDLIDYYATQKHRVNINRTWRGDTKILKKISSALLPWTRLLPIAADFREAFVTKCVKYIELSWRVSNLKSH